MDGWILNYDHYEESSVKWSDHMEKKIIEKSKQLYERRVTGL